MSIDPDLPLLPGPRAETRPVPVLWRRWADVSGAPTGSEIPTKSTLGSVTVALGILGLCVIMMVGVAQVLAGQTKLHGLVLLGAPMVAFIATGLGAGCCIHVYAHFARREDEAEMQTRFWNWWSDTIGGGVIKLAIGAAAVVLAYVVMHAVFAAMATSTGVIIALLFGIFLMLCQIAARLR